MKHTDNGWQADCLGAGFEMKYIYQPDDYSGPVRCTVIRKRASHQTGKAILYVHGFSDYFFQKEMVEVFIRTGYDFYAVDLRKYGRSLMSGQKIFQVRDMREYFADINSAISIMEEDKTETVIFMGHSTGGLTTSLYMADEPSPLVRALILNSPFLDWNKPPLLRNLAIPAISLLGRFLPNIYVSQKPDRRYAETLSAKYHGEWTYNTKWKPDILPNPDMGWIHAIHTAQQDLRKKTIKVPVLLLHSAESVKKCDDKEKYDHADAILDVNSISKYGKRLGANVTEVSFGGGLHDIALSKKPIRECMYQTILSWLKDNGF